MSEEAFQSLLGIAHSEQNWRDVKYQKHAQHPHSASFSQAQDGTPPALPESSVRITYRTDPRREIVVVRLTTLMPFSIETVCKHLLDANARKEWDLMFHRGKRIEKLDPVTDVR